MLNKNNIKLLLRDMKQLFKMIKKDKDYTNWQVID